MTKQYDEDIRRIANDLFRTARVKPFTDYTDIADAIQAERDRWKAERDAALDKADIHYADGIRFKAERDRLKAELSQTFTDENGTVWVRPTAESYALACKALHRKRAENERLKADLAEARKQIERMDALSDGMVAAWESLPEGHYKLSIVDQWVNGPMVRAINAIRAARAARKEATVIHPDELAVDRFASAMKAKLARKRAEGRGGWEDKDACSNDFLTKLLRDHVEKGDPIDVGNFAMMIHQRGEVIAPRKEPT